MARITAVEITYGERTTKGLDKYEHRDASATATVAIEDNDDPSGELEKAGNEVASQVRRLLGLTSKAEPARKENPVTQQARSEAEKTPTQEARENPAPSHPAKSDMCPKDDQGRPVASNNVKKVRGQNAKDLAVHLKAVHDAGNPVPDAQIGRLPKDLQTEVRNYVDNEPDQDPGEQDDDQEPAGSHDDPPVNDELKSGPDEDAAESDDPGENAEAEDDELSAVSDEDIRRIIVQAKRTMSKDSIMELLKTYNVNRFTEVTGRARTELYNYLSKAAEGGE